MPVATFFLATIAFAARPAEAQDRAKAPVTASINQNMSKSAAFDALPHSRANFAAFKAAGCHGVFREYAPLPGLIGHEINPAPAL